MTSYLKVFPRWEYLLLTLGVLMFCGGAMAQTPQQTVTVNWTAPTTRENGDPLPPAELAGYTLYYGQVAVLLDDKGYVNGVPPGVAVVEIAKDKVTQVATFNLAPRTQPYTVFYGLIAEDIYGLSSKVALLTQSITIKPASTPKAPTSIKVDLLCTGALCTLSIVQ